MGYQPTYWAHMVPVDKPLHIYVKRPPDISGNFPLVVRMVGIAIGAIDGFLGGLAAIAGLDDRMLIGAVCFLGLTTGVITILAAVPSDSPVRKRTSIADEIPF